jgi:hypothetical protein
MRQALMGSVVFMMVAAGAAAACGDASNTSSLGPGQGYDQPGADGGGTSPADGGTTGSSTDAGDGINTSGKGAGTGAATGLPCDVQQLLENRCIGCHLGPSPKPLLTYADLTAASATAGKNMAQQSLVRMQNAASPMPPAPAVAPDATEIKTFSDWVAANTPMGAVCTTLPDGGVDAGSTATNYNTPTVCTSNKTWNGGNNGSSLMQPGAACITCHTMRGGPAYKVAGTVYPTAHEPNLCNGTNGTNAPTVSVVVTDANNVVTTIAVNSVGNFSSRAAIVAPFHVKVTDSNGKTRAMAGSLTAGDCNSCHTLAGVNGAPGRIMAP